MASTHHEAADRGPDAHAPARLHDYLARHAVMTLATTGPAGAAAAAVFYACDGADLYFLSAPGTLHARNLAADPRVAATIQDDVDDWAAIKGVQLRGEAVQLAGEQEAQAMRCYAARFPAIFDPATCPPAIAAALPRIRWYRLGVRWWRLIDNSRGFGHAEEGAALVTCDGTSRSSAPGLPGRTVPPSRAT